MTDGKGDRTDETTKESSTRRIGSQTLFFSGGQ